MTGAEVRIGQSVGAFSAREWDALPGAEHPFVSHRFLALLEQSGSVGRGTGWLPAPITAYDADGGVVGALPAYLKTHSQGEYVFDQGWADAYQRAGGDYYPKLQIAVPFTPVPGPRILAADDSIRALLLAGAQTIVDNNGLSSAHATFIGDGDVAAFADAGWLIRTDTQYHWHNRGYRGFDDFLGDLASRKRKTIGKERAGADAAVDIVTLEGRDTTSADWDAMWVFYQHTGARKWGTPYLTRAAFDAIARTMANDVVLMLAYAKGSRGQAPPIAGALNIKGPDALHGRYWGATVHVPFLHFELCYYRAIDYAIAHGLPRVEAGAQGEHKLARGYAPIETHSAHYIADPGFREAVADFLIAERAAVDEEIEWLGRKTPFRRGDVEQD